MEEKKKKINIGGTGSYQKVISESVKVSTTQKGSKNVTIIVGTFLDEESTRSLFRGAIDYTYQQEGLKYDKVRTTKVEPEKVANTVGTFLTEDGDSFQVPATKSDSEKVANTVGTFSNEGSRNN